MSPSGVEALRRAVLSGHLEVTYDAVVEMAAGERVAWLARPLWNHPSFGRVRPEVFVPAAVSAGFADRLDAIVVEQALADVEAWPRTGSAAEPVFVGLQPSTLSTPGAPERTADLISRRGLLDRVGVEVPAPWLRERDGAETVARLVERGVMIGLDRFGCGDVRSSAVRKLGVRYLKVDLNGRSLEHRAWSATSLGEAAGLAAVLGSALVAQGIETRSPLRLEEGLATAS